MNISYVIGGLMGVGLLGGLLITSAMAPDMPDRNFQYKSATAQQQVDWLTAYGHFIHYTLESNDSKDEVTYKLVSVDPTVRGVSIDVNIEGGPEIDAETQASEEFQAKVAAKSSDLQDAFCMKRLQKEHFAGESKIFVTMNNGNVSIPNILVSGEVCSKIKKAKAVKSLFGNLKN